MQRLIKLGSGRWYGLVQQDARGLEFLFLSNADQPGDTMRVRLPFTWRMMEDQEIEVLARRPEIRLWTDEYGFQWRIAVVGPGTRYDLPVTGRFLIFDSQSTYAGIVRFPDGELGELTDEELRDLRNDTADLGGGRRSFRPPPGAEPEPTEH